MKLLVIEDDADHACLVGNALRGHEVRIAATLASAIEALEQECFDAIMSDLSLPDARGVDAVGRLRRAARDCPLVVLTASEDDQLAMQVLDAGAQDYLVKDVVLADEVAARKLLCRTIQHAVRRQEWRRESDSLVHKLQESAELLEGKNRRLEALCDTAQRFIENVSHDFRTPLTVIKEYVTLLADGIVGKVNEKQDQMLRVVDDRADDLNTMVDDLLDVSKLQAGLLNVWRRPWQVGAIVERLQSGLTRKAAVRQITLETDVDEDLPEVFCDGDKVGRALTNLAVNAVKFCRPQGKVKIWARANPEAREVVVGVSDEGPGIEQDKLEAIFTRFTQLDSGARHCEKGFGLGLSIAKELVELNLGQIAVESVIDVGTTFQFTIPYHDQQEVLSRYFSRLKHVDGSKGRCALVTATASEDADPRAQRDFDLFLSNNVRRNDLALRTAPGQWLLLFEVSSIELECCLERTERALGEISRNRPFGELPPLALEARGEIEGTLSIAEAVNRSLELTSPEACYV